MFISRENLKALARTHVCEIKFRRRNIITGKPLYRRMLCTSAQNILNTIEGRLTLNYRPTTSPPFTNRAYNPDQHNLVILWDIIMQDYRAINMSFCNLIARVPANEKFWEYFRDNIYQKSSAEKMAWMNM
jgi:hypothetical protein